MKNNKQGGAALPKLAVLTAALLISTTPAFAGKTIPIDQNKSITIGAALRTSFETKEDSAASGSDRSLDIGLEDVRLLMSGQVLNKLKFEFNTNYSSGTGEYTVIDGITQLEFTDGFNLWMGRFLPPSDRSNLSGPYYGNMWDYPGHVSRYGTHSPGKVAGRDDGIAAWGTFDNAKIKYQAGLFKGTDSTTPTGANPEDKPLAAGRFVFNFWDGEPGYYNSSTYYGEKDILAIGFVLQAQQDSVGGVNNLGDFFGQSFDFLFEKKLGGGVLDVEAAIYRYDYDNVQPDETSFMVVGSYLLPNKVGMGKLQPKARLQIRNHDGAGNADESITVFDLQLDYIMDGHNARSSIILSNEDPEVGDSKVALKFGIQLQI